MLWHVSYNGTGHKIRMKHRSGLIYKERSLSGLTSRVLTLTAVCGLLIHPLLAQSQPMTPNRSAIFGSDSPQYRAAQQKALKQSLVPAAKPAQGLDFQAPSIEFNREKNEVTGKGGISIAEGGVQVQADEGTFNLRTKEGDVVGNVLMTTSSGVLSATSAHVNVPNETGQFSDLEFDIEESGFNIRAKQARKISEFEFELEDSSVTSCRCLDGSRPWEIRSDSCSITREGYAHSYDSAMWLEGMPIFYSPYLAFPVKSERASGMLAPQVGYSNQNGFLYRQPIFLDVDDSTGFMLNPFLASSSRVGSEITFEKRFSTTSRLDAGFIYSNESLRGDSLRGLDITGLADPTIDTNRTAGFYKQRWRADPKSESTLELIVDGRYTSDNLFLREIPAPEIGSVQSQFLTSTALARGRAFSFLNTEARAEYNQMLITPQDLQFQRLPELAASTGETFRPWGANQFGLKVVTEVSAVGTDFARQDGYDGLRLDLNPKVSIPFHVKNYLRGQFSVQLHQTQYDMRETTLPADATPLPDGSTELDGSMGRTLPIVSYSMGTAMERIYGLDRDNWFSNLAALGARNQGSELVRLKHTIEPTVGYTYIPGVDQENNPLYDALDRFRERSLFSYGVTSRLYGRFQEPYERLREVEELASSASTLPMFDLSDSLLEFGRGMIISPASMIDTREGEIRELAMFSVRQTYDNLVAQQDDDPTLDPFSDINAAVVLSPSYYLSTGFQTNYHAQDGSFSSYALNLGIRDDREDALRARYTYIADSTNQLELNGEIKLVEQLRAGLYGRYDAENQEMIESRGLIRFMNSCKCWAFDMGITQRVNPDNKQILFSFTFGGLGGISQGNGVNQ